jgi:Icc-related predicted phosphoesterase
MKELNEGIKIWASPVTPGTSNTNFQMPRNGEMIKNVWEAIPENLDILITHGPPFRILDNDNGCGILYLQTAKQKPRVHLFGKVHGKQGSEQHWSTMYMNCTMLKAQAPLDTKNFTLENQYCTFNINPIKNESKPD